MDADIIAPVAPRSFGDLKALIGARLASFPRRLAQIAEYALAYPDDVALGTAAGIAEKCGVQPSALVRFSQSLGYSGFTDMQSVFQSRLRERVPSYEERLAHLRERGEEISNAALLLSGFSEAATRSLDDLRSSIDHAVIDAAVAALAKAETIYLVGLRRSFPVVAYIAYAMGNLGIRNVLIDGVAGLGAEQLRFITPRDALLAVSFTPYARETAVLAESARALGPHIVAITNSPLSPLAPYADTRIEISEANFEGFRSIAATMALGITLAVAVASERGGSPAARQ